MSLWLLHLFMAIFDRAAPQGVGVYIVYAVLCGTNNFFLTSSWWQDTASPIPLQMILLILLPLLAAAQDRVVSTGSMLRVIQTNGTDSIQSIFDSLPKECLKNGKKYKEGEKFELGHLLYQCQKYGVYSIEGCLTDKKYKMKIGERLVVDNVVYQCLAKDNSVYYRQTVCGILGQPECEQVDLPAALKTAQRMETADTVSQIQVPGLPPGWKLIDETGQQIPGTSARVISRTLIFNPVIQPERTRRQMGHGVGSVVGMEDVGTDKPPMPMSMLLGESNLNSKSASSLPSATNSNDASNKEIIRQTVSRTLQLTGENNAKNRVAGVGTGSTDLNQRTATRGDVTGLKTDSIEGSRSDVQWKGKTISVNGKSIAAGPGTFTFGNSPTVFLKREN